MMGIETKALENKSLRIPLRFFHYKILLQKLMMRHASFMKNAGFLVNYFILFTSMIPQAFKG